MDIEAEEEERTRVFPSELPMQFPYARPRYYVRKCYSEYYDLILEMLADHDIVTVTGTAGIGKSLFYAYFYQRYTENEEDEEDKRKKIIIAISFARDSQLRRVVAFHEDGRQTEPSDGEDKSSFILKTHRAALARDVEVTYLCDGPPNLPPELHSKLVCFTSPNERWLRMTEKEEQACELYMPLWTLDELLDAAKHLDLGAGVTQEKIKERFAVFGGVARGCLSAKEKFVATMTEDLIKAITRMDSFSELKRLVNNVEGEATRHGMCHYQPMADNRGSYDVQTASTFVTRLVLEKLTARDDEERRSLIRWLRGVRKAAALRGHLFEMKAHEQLVRGGVIETRCISEMDKPMVKFTLDRSKDFCFFDHKELSTATIEESGPYHIPRAANFESVGSFYCHASYVLPIRRKLLLFRMTVSSTDPVKGEGIVALLKAVGWLDRAVEDPVSRVALIFVCPDGSEKVIEDKQRISWTPAAGGESVTVIPGIGGAMEEALAGVNVRTLEDFRTKFPELMQSKEGWLQECVRHFEKFEGDQTVAGSMFPRIPQYVWRLG